ncbi:MAG: 4-hydroxy-tetrahydrodipicolinate reductase [Bacillota bacterium]|nr:4-hydroxy-tetrahydrodipicolinate reductase [Bacillota bacterium]
MVVGAAGKMGREVVKAVAGAPDLELVAAVDQGRTGEDAGEVAGLGKIEIPLRDDLEEALAAVRPQVMVDFTRPEGLLARIAAALRHGVRPVVGTTGLSQSEIDQVASLAAEKRLGCLIAPNFAIGALVLMRCAGLAARYFAQAEIIELHHAGKVDAPSGTALKTADVIAAARRKASATPMATPGAESERVAGVRGGECAGVRVHSVRLPGLVAHQEVLFGNAGEVFTLRHDSLSRESFMPGVLLAIRAVTGLSGLVYGLDKLIFGEEP